jgi:biotin transport system substrate-specific component
LYSDHQIKVSFLNELIWALIGLFLTIFSTFIQAFFTNPPWLWHSEGIQPQPLGINYQIGAVLLTGCLGGKNAGMLAQVAYIILGLFWLPVFSHGGGLEYFREPSFGYILGFIPGGAVAGWWAFHQAPKLESLTWSALLGLGVIHLCGLIYLVALSLLKINGSPTIAPENLGVTMLNYSLLPLCAQLILVCLVGLLAFILRKVLLY